MKIILSDPSGNYKREWEKIGEPKDYLTIFQGSIFDVSADAIVSPANSFGFMDGGLDLSISEYFGWHLQDHLQKLIKEKHHGELLVGTAEIVETEHNSIPYMIAAPTMRVPMILNDSVNVYLAVRAALLLVKHGTFSGGGKISEKVKTISFPGMGTGVGRIPPEIFIRQFKYAMEEVIEGKDNFPESWYEASMQHQLLYSPEHRDLQFEE